MKIYLAVEIKYLVNVLQIPDNDLSYTLKFDSENKHIKILNSDEK